MFKEKIICITGGTGSFGQAIVERFLKLPVKEIRIFSRDEKKQHDMRKKFNDERLKFYLGDVRQMDSLKDVMEDVDFVFHAAALKQVPSCEFFPLEAVKTNILGTENVLSAAIAAGVKKVICLSTDKAAYPINAMGISKAMMEKVMIARAVTSQNTVICGTRYGNVLASRGSVIPLFIEQIKAGEPLTVTDPQMTRFFMTLEEAVELVLYAFEHGEAGDIFVQKAPASTIGQLAQALKELYAQDHDITIIGTRPGEKSYETLLTREEYAAAQDLGEFYRVPADRRRLPYNKYFTEGDHSFTKAEEYNSYNTRQLTLKELKKTLQQLDICKKLLPSNNGVVD